MGRKSAGYILLVIGVLILLASLKQVQDTFHFTLPESFSTPVAIITGTIILMIGLALSGKDKSSPKKNAEVPIYQGNQIIGYRRH
ncbi:hypothetical protein COU54_03815 [Candidatus Pacearchaeota archaeon CG10_big_fil_rev_8_21_14_0_10_31_24]|nr:MAG: hypothetical protein COU54_03815 [Candidatus Pacearchaeota archaeon CG10_big_fil_rev_8_21_14_0_10_31_24]